MELVGTKGYNGCVSIANCNMKNVIWIKEKAKLSVVDKPWETKKRLRAYIKVYNKLYDKYKLYTMRLLNLEGVTLLD
jgi:hypothetical protein